MNPYHGIEGMTLWHIAGWTMVHFLWLGALVGIAAAALRLVLRRASPNARYVATTACLALLAALTPGIAGWLVGTSPPFQEGATGGFVSASKNSRFASELHDAAGRIDSIAELDLAIAELPGKALVSPTQVDPIDNATEPSPRLNQKGRGVLVDVIESCIVYLPWVWLVGTPLTLVLLATGIVGTERLRRASQPVTTGPLTEMAARLAKSLRVGRRVAIAVSDRVCAPVLVGILRPIILLPPAALTGWSPAEIEMVLLHELAHVRRWDNLVNLLQRLVESLLFFHPAVWLVSGWMRRDREACCDAVVVRHTNNRRAYAELLVSLASQESEAGRPRPRLLTIPLGRRGRGRRGTLASAMAAGPLRNRIRYILQMEDDSMLVTGKSFALVLAGLLTAATLAVLYLPARGQAEESTAEVAGSAETGEEQEESRDDAEEQTPEELQIDSPNGEAETGAGGDGVKEPTEPSDEDRATKPIAESHRDEGAAGAGGRRVLGTFPMNAVEPGDLFRYVEEARSKGDYVDIVTNEGKWELVVVPQPTEADWPGMLGDAPRKERVIADKAWEQLGLKVVPASMLESIDFETRRLAGPIKILGGNVPKGLPLPAFVRRIGENSLDTFDDLHVWLNEREGKRPIPVKIYAFADGHDYLFDAEPPGESPEGMWPNGIAFSSPEDGAIAMRAWKELGIKTAPLGREEIVLVRAHGYRRGLKLVDFEGFPQLNGPFILTEFSSKTISQGVASFTDLQTILDAFASGPADEVAVLKGVHRGGKFDYSMRRPQEKPAVAGGPQSRFPSLEEQKLADLAWRMLQLELELASEGDLKRVRTLGYQGGVLVTETMQADRERRIANEIQRGDILVGLHVWPTTSLDDVANILTRDDLAELNPLKFYVVRAYEGSNVSDENIVTGRISVRSGGTQSTSGSPPVATQPRSENPLTADRYAAVRPPGNRPEAASESEIKVLQDHIKTLHSQFDRIDALFKAGRRGGHASTRALAAYELAVSTGELAMMQGQRAQALKSFHEAQSQAEDAFKAMSADYEAGNTTYDVVLLTSKNLADIKRKIIQLEQQRTAPNRAAVAGAEPATSFAAPEAGGAANPPATSAAPEPNQSSSPNKRRDAGVTISAESQEALDEFMRLASSPQQGDSMSVLKTIVNREKQKYDRMVELAKNGQVTQAEAETQRANYEISMERLRQAERALEYYKAQVQLAAAEYEAALEASKQAPRSVPDLELRKLQLKLQLAEAKYKELAE